MQGSIRGRGLVRRAARDVTRIHDGRLAERAETRGLVGVRRLHREHVRQRQVDVAAVVRHARALHVMSSSSLHAHSPGEEACLRTEAVSARA